MEIDELSVDEMSVDEKPVDKLSPHRFWQASKSFTYTMKLSIDNLVFIALSRIIFTWARFYKTFYDRKLRMLVIS